MPDAITRSLNGRGPARSSSFRFRRSLSLFLNKRAAPAPVPCQSSSPTNVEQTSDIKGLGLDCVIAEARAMPISVFRRHSVQTVMSSAAPSPSRMSSIFDELDETVTEEDSISTDPTSASPGNRSYELKPSPPLDETRCPENLALRLYSIDHLNAILRNPTTAASLRRFMLQYRPEYATALIRYTKCLKAITAIEYVNTIASVSPDEDHSQARPLATVNERFVFTTRPIAEDLAENLLPAFLTFCFTNTITEILVKDITGSSMPFMRKLVSGLGEVYCISDPTKPDNPIVYASNAFFRTTQYGRDYVFGRNCRFLQGPQTSPSTIKRLSRTLRAGLEACETVLNYKRDGTPFLNLLFVAPLHDDKGQIRYHVGCQIDITPLIEDGRGLESFNDLLSQDLQDEIDGPDGLTALSRLGGLLSDDEAERLLQQRQTLNRESDDGLSDRSHFCRQPRRIYGISEDMEQPGQRRAVFGLPNRLPAVYQNFLLVRPHPSLRIVFTSPALRIPGLIQTKFLDRIGGDESVRSGVSNAMAEGVSVTARVKWLPTTGTAFQHAHAPPRRFKGVPRDRWIHCTPLIGSDGRVGVWMVLMVEDEPVTGQLNAHRPPGIIDYRRSAPVSHSSASASSFDLEVTEALAMDRRASQPTPASLPAVAAPRPVSRGRALTRVQRTSVKNPVNRTTNLDGAASTPSISTLPEEDEFRIIETR